IGAADIEISSAGDCRLVVARDRCGGAISLPGGTGRVHQGQQAGDDHGAIHHESPRSGCVHLFRLLVSLLPESGAATSRFRSNQPHPPLEIIRSERGREKFVTSAKALIADALAAARCPPAPTGINTATDRPW